jgi:hypothetical protein
MRRTVRKREEKKRFLGKAVDGACPRLNHGPQPQETTDEHGQAQINTDFFRLQNG